MSLEWNCENKKTLNKTKNRMQNTVRHLVESELKSDKYSRDVFLKRRLHYANNLYSKDLKAHFSCVNSIEFSSNESDYLISGTMNFMYFLYGKKRWSKSLLLVHTRTGGDDKRVLLWNINKDVTSAKNTPTTMKTQHNSNIFALAWDNENKRIFSGGNDHQVIVHDVET